RQPRQGLRLVRQRVGLQLPPRRPRRPHRCDDAGGRRVAVRLPRSVRDADVAGKTVLVRADLNVPLEEGEGADGTRIRASLPTPRLLLDGDAADVRVCSHLGRPASDEDRARFSLDPVERRLHELLPDERIHVLENTRFSPGETANDAAYAKELSDGC